MFHIPMQVRRRRRKPSCRDRSLRLERLEERITPSLLTTFELDGNATTGVLGTSGSTTTSHDWDQVFADAGSPTALGAAAFTNGPSSGALTGSFTRDAVNSTADDIFTGGGSKDTNGIQNWLFTPSKPQGKDDIKNAFAAAYTDTGSGHLILYAGLDRYDNSGDSTAGFWFFGNQIGQNPNVTANGGHPFTGQHQNGDILLISNFTQGGSVSTIAVYEWVGNDSTGSLKLIGGNASNTFAIVNGAPISVPWSYANKAGQTQPQAGEFLEEGVDLTALGLSGCFDTFLAETRSSQAPTATLSDFTLGSFPVCSIAATPFNGLSKFDTFTHQGDLVTYPLTVTNTGAVTLYVQNVSDTLLGNIVVNGVVQTPGAAGVNPAVTAISTSGLSADGSLAPGASVTFFVTRRVQQTDPDPTTSTATFVYNDDAGPTFGPDQDTASATNTVNLFQPSVSLTETASPAAGVVGTPITYTYKVTNTSSSDSPALVLDTSNPSSSFTSTEFGNIEADAIHALAGNSTATTATLAPGASFSFTETHVLTAMDPTPLTDMTSAVFTLAQNLGAFPNLVHSNTTTATVHIVNAEISIDPSATNAVGQPHTFTVTVKEDLGDGNGFVAAPGASVTVALTNANGASYAPFGSVPLVLSGTTNGSGQFAVEFTSATAGQVTGNATATLSVQGVSLTRATGDSFAGDGAPAVKTFVDERISIGPNATNGITEPHTFTATVLENLGDGNGFVVPVANQTVTVKLTNSNGAVAIPATPLSGMTNASGQFQVTFTSDSAGQVIGNASTSFTVNGATETRSTGDSQSGDGGPATKTFVAGKILWKKVDQGANLLAGATFLVTATGGTAAGLSPKSVTVVDNGPSDANATGGLFELDAFQSFGGSSTTGLALGTYTIQETVPPPGYTLDPKILTVTLTQSSLTGDLTATPFVDTLPNLNIVKTVTANQTVIHPGDTASYTITVSNTGAGTANSVVLTDTLPDANMLPWMVTSHTGFTSAGITGGVLTASAATMVGGGSASVVISAVVPLNFFGNTSPGAGNGDPVPSTLFEIDGNATVQSSQSHDWNQVYADNTASPRTSTAAAIVSSFTTDETSGDPIFTGGSTKDTLPLSGWLFKTGKPQDKDEILNAASALYRDPSTNDVILYTMADRYSNSGDSTMGFWFFVNPVSKGAGTGGSTHFTGTHTTGDLLLISDFTVGGSVATIAVYEWVGDDATGHLVNVTAMGNPSTVAVVNTGSPGVAWPFKDKSGASQPQAGEFIEEGVNLSGLGLDGCFSSFLAETRSSQSTTATLSDFLLGSFSTCDVQLPNKASVTAANFNNGQPLNSSTVTIDLNDGMAQLASSTVSGSGSGAATPGLTGAELQPVVAQADAAWLAAGADPSALSNLANYAIHIANLPDGELGYETPGQIWIDPTAQGWGWSTGATPAPGRMDLLTVVSHEVGHMLGFGDGDSGVMEAALAPGIRVVPAPVTGTTTVDVFGATGIGSGVGTGATAVAAPSLAAAGAPGVAQPGVAVSLQARTAAGDASSPTGTRIIVMVPSGGASSLDDAGLFRALVGVPLYPLPQLPGIVSPMATIPAAIPAGTGQEAPGSEARAYQPLVGNRARDGGDPAVPNPDAPENDALAWPLARDDRGNAPRDSGAGAPLEELLRRRAIDACFADAAGMAPSAIPGSPLAPADSRSAERAGRPEHAGPDRASPQADPDATTSAVALALVLGGCWWMHRADSPWRRGRRLRI
jgi:uncharacterized repeat protein (TIGR01451 family)